MTASSTTEAPRPDAPPPLLDPQGPAVVLGGHDAFDGPLVPRADTLYGPRGALLTERGSLWVSDTGHHRVLGWRTRPREDRAPADLVLGQPSFTTEGRNAGHAAPRPDTMDMPVAIASLPGGGLAVADSWNHRVLIFRRAPTESGTPACIALGQATLEEGLANRGLDAPRPDTLHWPFSVLEHEGRLVVADAGNRRVLVWNTIPDVSGAPADLVLGQATLETRDDNGGGPADARTMRWPHDLALWQGRLAVADAGNNRVLVWDGLPTTSNEPARVVLGQPDFASVDHNAGTYDPTARSLNMPYGLAVHGETLMVADTASSRFVGFDEAVTYGEASRLTGQVDFRTKGDNRWQLPVRDSLCWPYGLRVAGDEAIVADTGNQRVVLWSVAR